MPEPDKQFIRNYLDKYSETQGLLPEKLEEFGEKYKAQGHLTKEQLYQIAYESSTRSAYHVKKNKEEHCRKITEDITKVSHDISQISLICSLKGFKAPIGSSVLAAYKPENHAVVDTRVWASLERLGFLEERKEQFGPRDYLKMIKPIRKIAEETGFKPVTIGYALFAHDFEVREGTLH